MKIKKFDVELESGCKIIQESDGMKFENCSDKEKKRIKAVAVIIREKKGKRK